MTEWGPCAACGADDDAVLRPVWGEVEDYEAGEPPDLLGCEACGVLRPYDPDAEPVDYEALFAEERDAALDAFETFVDERTGGDE